MKSIKERYYDKANDLFERLLDEQDPEDENSTEVAPEDEEPDTAGDNEQGQSEQVEVFFDSLDEKTQKLVMDALRNNLNLSDNDDYGNQKIVEALANKPITILNANELVHQMDIDI